MKFQNFQNSEVIFFLKVENIWTCYDYIDLGLRPQSI